MHSDPQNHCNGNTAREIDIGEVQIADDHVSPLHRNHRHELKTKLHGLFRTGEESRSHSVSVEDHSHSRDSPDIAASLIESFTHLGLKSAATLLKVGEAAFFQEDVNDRHYVMESVIKVRALVYQLTDEN